MKQRRRRSAAALNNTHCTLYGVTLLCTLQYELRPYRPVPRGVRKRIATEKGRHRSVCVQVKVTCKGLSGLVTIPSTALLAQCHQPSPGFFPPEPTVRSFPFSPHPFFIGIQSAFGFRLLSIHASNSANRNLGSCPLSLSGTTSLLAWIHTPRHFPRNPSRLSIHLYHVHDYHPSTSRLAIPPSTSPPHLMSLLVRGSAYYIRVADGIGT